MAPLSPSPSRFPVEAGGPAGPPARIRGQPIARQHPPPVFGAPVPTVAPAAPSPRHAARLDALLERIQALAPTSVADLGAGTGALFHRLVAETTIPRLIAVEVDATALATLKAGLPPHDPTRVALHQGTFVDLAPRLGPVDLALMIETIEHTDPEHLSQLENALFARLRPAHALITTPNADANAALGVPPHRLRHWDHRFEWGRARFTAWAERTAARHRYRATWFGLGEDLGPCGPATQGVAFERL